MKDSKKFYEKLGTSKLSKLTSKQLTKAQLNFLKKYLSKDQKILDVACGFGRLTIPLAKDGYDIEGVDLAPNLIKDAKNYAEQENLKIKFCIADMRKLPYKNKTFDVVICMWSSFCHLLIEKDQIAAIKEMYRILKSSGQIIIDLPYFSKPTKQMEKFGKLTGKNKNILQRTIAGFKTQLYLHTKNTALDLLNKIFNLKNYEVKYRNIGRKKRLIIRIFAKTKTLDMAKVY